MRLIHAYINGITRLNEFIGRWVAYLIFLIFMLLLLEVFMRYLFSSPTSWTNELGQMLFGAYVVLSGGYVMAHRDHVNVDLLYASFGPRTRAWVDIFTSSMFFCSWLHCCISAALWPGSRFKGWKPPTPPGIRRSGRSRR